jgi:RNA polymerase sigma factor (sigma-70 family)
MPRPHDSDADLISRCLAGESAAWETLVDRYARMVYSVPRRMGLPADVCDDVFQDVFATVLRSLGSLRNQSRFPSWLLRVAYRASWLVAAPRAGPPAAGLSTPPEVASDEQLIRWEQQALVRRALDQLDPRCRDLLLALFAPNAASYREIAQRLSIPIGSIGPSRNRCLAGLLEAMKALAREELE